jgi:two-component system response regulator DctR
VLLERIRAALQIDCQAHAVATQHEGVIGQLAHLTPREREVMELLLMGKTSKEIADTLHRSVRTVEGHRRMVFMKMGVSSAAQLVGIVMNTRQSRPRA